MFLTGLMLGLGMILPLLLFAFIVFVVRLPIRRKDK